jgi:hypothetical protein
LGAVVVLDVVQQEERRVWWWIEVVCLFGGRSYDPCTLLRQAAGSLAQAFRMAGE